MIIDEVKTVLADILQLGQRTQAMDEESLLLGAIPELDSMAVVSLIVGLEDRFGITVEDDEIGAATFATLGSLCTYIDSKMLAVH
ncbi:MAG TPA: acyl carrier protein [Burkholderiales bacterium]|nr:acyl carrier protein [Burkholderiales bacterium]